jgi:hypothetical protein
MPGPSKQFLKAAAYTTTMMAAEAAFYAAVSALSNSGHDDHHHHHHSDQSYIASVAGKFVNLTIAIVLIIPRMGLAYYSNNNSLTIGAGEFAGRFFSAGGAIRGVLGAGVSHVINTIAPDEPTPPTSSTKKKM